MILEWVPQALQQKITPEPSGELIYRCLGCGLEVGIGNLLYTCPKCKQVLLIHDVQFDRLKKTSGEEWQQIFDIRKMTKLNGLKGIYRFHELIGPTIPLDDIVYLGEGHTPVIKANQTLQEMVGLQFYFKNDGQNPSASFKDRGMASAISYINFLMNNGALQEVISICASTGDTSAAAALYASYLHPKVKSVVLLPRGKVTPQQLAQPLGHGAAVFEIPGVFDDCMKVVEAMAERYPVALLNSKNAWRILGQESYSYEVAQEFEYDMRDKVVVLPIGNAGNISAVLNGFLKLFDLGIITNLPKIIGVQSEHADPVYRYYLEPDSNQRKFIPITVKPSVAQAAMIGNPVSMPRVIHLVESYNRASNQKNVFIEQVSEQDIIDWQLRANRNGHIACTHGGESLAGLFKAINRKLIEPPEQAIIYATAHALKFVDFQNMYFEGNLPTEYGVKPDPKLQNSPQLIMPSEIKNFPAPGYPLEVSEMNTFVDKSCKEIASIIHLKTV